MERIDTNDLPTAERYETDIFYPYLESGEEFAEKQWAKIKPDEIPVIKTASLALLAFGIKSYK